jgi:hypothetical protein
MKLMAFAAGIFVVVLASGWWMAGCSGDVKPQVAAGIDVCSECNMVIDKVNEACGYVVGNEFVAFDSPGCLLRGCESTQEEGQPLPELIYFADYRDATFHLADSTSFLLTRSIPTVMNAQVVCFGDRSAAEDQGTDPDDLVTDWLGYRTARGTPDEILNVTIGVGGMDPEVVEVEKGDLVLWKMMGRDLELDLVITIRGYSEAGTITIPASGEEIELRMIANRPGAGFPLVPEGGGDPLGMMKVSGAHTMDEEQM